MSERVKIYHPETDEMFEVPQHRADQLILNEGWRQQPLDPNASPAVQTIGVPPQSEEDWRESEVGAETVDGPLDETTSDH